MKSKVLQARVKTDTAQDFEKRVRNNGHSVSQFIAFMIGKYIQGKIEIKD